MSEPAMRRVGQQTDRLGECPVWSVPEGALYWVDIRRPAIRRSRPAAGPVETWPVPDMVGAVGLIGDGRLVAALGNRVALFRLGAGGLEPVLRDTRIPNSLCWSPDGGTMYFADSLAYGIDAYPYDLATGGLGEPRRFSASEPPAFPDGSTVDADGCVWTAEFDGGRVLRRAPDGRLLRTVAVPVPRPTSCAFGGENLDVLYVTTASRFMTEAERAALPLAGALLALDVGVRGLPEPLVRLPDPRISP